MCALAFGKSGSKTQSPEVTSACYAALNYLESKGATVVPIEIPHLRYMSLAHAAKITGEFAVKFDDLLHNNPEALEPNTKVTVGVGSSMTALEVLAGERLRAWAFDYVDELMQKKRTFPVSLILPSLCYHHLERGCEDPRRE